jgi:hypothetical protein
MANHTASSRSKIIVDRTTAIKIHVAAVTAFVVVVLHRRILVASRRRRIAPKKKYEGQWLRRTD